MQEARDLLVKTYEPGPCMRNAFSIQSYRKCGSSPDQRVQILHRIEKKAHTMCGPSSEDSDNHVDGPLAYGLLSRFVNLWGASCSAALQGQ